MENSAKVFSSNITRVGSNQKNNLYDLLNIVPAIPLTFKDKNVHNTCDYSPKTDKYYIPKRKSRLKVKTVRDIRKSFEQDTYNHLFTDLETQQNILFKKIRRGSSRDDNTKKLAKKMLKDNMPISRSTWQMLININPENHNHPRQYVLWNGKNVQVNGSYGGFNKNICNFDLVNKILPVQSYKGYFKHYERHKQKKKKLLRNSLDVKFKPGPLCKKLFLDNSYQKYHVGNAELVNLPKPGLDIHPQYGVALEPSITTFLTNLREKDGTITQKWAELAVSVLGTVEKSKAIQMNRDCITFDLAYKYNQNRLLMRCDGGNCYNSSVSMNTSRMYTNTHSEENHLLLEIEDIMDKIIDSVEISLIQDKIFNQEEEFKPFPTEDLNSAFTATQIKDKPKRKFGELDRLDVTVITLPESREESILTERCDKMHCSLGCICSSLEGTYNLKQHCGRVECMFYCKCDFSKYKSDLKSECPDLFPGLLNLENNMNCNLAKEEQKFHQTVIVTGEKRILLKAQKRNWKSSKKFADFYSTMNLKHENKKKQDLSIVVLKLNCHNIESWCMVHKLYKCFCKGKFTEICASDANETVAKESMPKDVITDSEYLHENTNEMNIEDRNNPEWINSVKKTKISDYLHNKKTNKMRVSKSLDKSMIPINISENVKHADLENEIQINCIPVKDTGNVVTSTSVLDKIRVNIENRMTTRQNIKQFNMQQKSSISTRWNKKNENVSDSEDSDYLDFLDEERVTSSRTSGYEGRKYSDGYYRNTNYKILAMEKNDKRLHERLAYLYSKNCEDDICTTTNATNTVAVTHTITSSTISTTNTITSTAVTTATTFKPTMKFKSNATSFLQLPSDTIENSNDLTPSKSNMKPLTNDNRLVTWLESNYKLYRERNNKGLFKNSLEPPQNGKVALHSWNFILKRYRERKNLFLVTRQKPIRIFMAVNTESPFFENCIDINNIRFADLHKYPQTVKNLLINATDVKDNFCILRGLANCWELIGSVTKVNDSDEHVDTPEGIKRTQSPPLLVFNEDSSVVNKSIEDVTEQKDFQSQTIMEKVLENSAACLDDAGSSKWFVMTIENDFSEIRFFRRGFFVKYGSIINAINVARLSGKTVRLSSKKCTEQPEAPQFGIYAIPNKSEYCVFVGPYEIEDSLGIETIKTILSGRRFKRTRGFWITTNKVDNLKVVENPLLFVPSTNAHNIKVFPLENHFCANDETGKNQQEKTDLQESVQTNQIDESKESSPSKKGIKIVKPIKIRKTNGFYHLASDGLFKKISVKYPQTNRNTMPVVMNACSLKENDNTTPVLKPDSNQNTDTPQEPVTDTASQIKISAVFSTKNEEHIIKRTSNERGMFILKPEEINERLIQNKFTEMTSVNGDKHNINNEIPSIGLLQSNLDLFPTESNVCAMNDDVYVISDDENHQPNNANNENCNIWSDVWIQCTNIPKLGWIAGIKNSRNLLSFKLPGCEYSEFYTEEEAFTKINLELLKKVNKSIDFKLQWKVNESIEQVHGEEINVEHLFPDYILTQEGLIHTSDIIKSNKDNLKTYSKQQKNKGRGLIPASKIGKKVLRHGLAEGTR